MRAIVQAWKNNKKWTINVSYSRWKVINYYPNGEIILINISTSLIFQQTLDMLNKAFQKYDNLEGLIFQSEQGWEVLNNYQKILIEKWIVQSMPKKGNSSLMKNFFWKMKNEMFYGKYTFKTLEELKIVMKKYTDYYNHHIIIKKLKGLIPVQYRNQPLLIA